MSAIPRVVVSAPSSGHGKTAVSVGLLAAFTARGYRATGFKIGPDHVDAAYLGLAAGRPGRNLDPRLAGVGRMVPLFTHGATALDIAVVEGTMGLFDGLAGRTDTESTAQISGLLRAPVVLVVDVGAMGQSVAALVHGFRAYDELLWLGGVILNRVASGRHEQLLREALDDIGVPVLGALRRGALTEIGEMGAPLPARQHGVEPVAHGSIAAVRAVRRLGEVIAASVDVERTMALARSAPRLTAEPWSAEEQVGTSAKLNGSRRPLVAVAGGPRFSYSYVETTELLRAAGADVVHFDPLHDEHLPLGTDGVVIGAGLPEGYAEELSFNASLRAEITAHARAGRPIAAEGTGYVWLCKDLDGRAMCGILDATAKRTDLTVLGYRDATSRTSSVLLPAGTSVVGHKMHRTLVTPRSGPQPAWSWTGGPAEGFVQGAVHASTLALHWAGRPEIAARFVSAVASHAPEPALVATPGAFSGPVLGGPPAGGPLVGGPTLSGVPVSAPQDDVSPAVAVQDTVNLPVVPETGAVARDDAFTVRAPDQAAMLSDPEPVTPDSDPRPASPEGDLDSAVLDGDPGYAADSGDAEPTAVIAPTLRAAEPAAPQAAAEADPPASGPAPTGTAAESSGRSEPPGAPESSGASESAGRSESTTAPAASGGEAAHDPDRTEVIQSTKPAGAGDPGAVAGAAVSRAADTDPAGGSPAPAGSGAATPAAKEPPGQARAVDDEETTGPTVVNV